MQDDRPIELVASEENLACLIVYCLSSGLDFSKKR